MKNTISISETIQTQFEEVFDYIISQNITMEQKLNRMDEAFDLPIKENYYNNLEVVEKQKQIQIKINNAEENFKSKNKDLYNDIKNFENFIREHENLVFLLDSVTEYQEFFKYSSKLYSAKSSVEKVFELKTETSKTKRIHDKSDRKGIRLLAELILLAEDFPEKSYDEHLSHLYTEIVQNMKSLDVIKIINLNIKTEPLKLILKFIIDKTEKETNNTIFELEKLKEDLIIKFDIDDLKENISEHLKLHPKKINSINKSPF